MSAQILSAEGKRTMRTRGVFIASMCDSTVFALKLPAAARLRQLFE
jgi:hypothetical protein